MRLMDRVAQGRVAGKRGAPWSGWEPEGFAWDWGDWSPPNGIGPESFVWEYPEIEPPHPLDLPALRDVRREAVLRALAEAGGRDAGVVAAVVREVAAEALRGPGARTRAGWDRAMAALRVVLGTALQDGIRDARPPRPGGAGWSLPPGATWDAVYALVRGHVAARFREPEAATPEGRSRVKAAVTEMLWDALLDAVKAAPPPRPGRRPRRQA